MVRQYILNLDVSGLFWGLVGLIGILLSGYFYMAGKREKKPIYSLDGELVVEHPPSAVNGVEIVFNGQVEPRIAVSHLFFWNAGAEPIRQSDIPSSNELQILVGEGATVLAINILAVTDPACQVTLLPPLVQENGSTLVPFKFLFLDKQDGFVAQIIHNGIPSHHIKCIGKVIGGAELEQVTVDRHGVAVCRERTTLPFGAVISGVIGLLLMSIAIIQLHSLIPEWATTSIAVAVMALSAFIGGRWTVKYDHRFLPVIPHKLRAVITNK